MKKIFLKIFSVLHKNRINIFSTVYANFMLLPLKEAIQLPILIFGNCTIYNPCGRVVFNQKIKCGLLKIGMSHPVRSYYSKSFIHISGTLYLGKNVILRKGINLAIYENANLILDDNVSIGNNTTIICTDKIHIGEATSIGNNTTFMDTDFHHILNIKKREVKKMNAPINIGKNCWIGGYCTIKKNTKLPKGTILAGPYSMVSKDYTTIIPEYSLIAGLPAKLLAEGFRRINNNHVDEVIYKYMSEYNTSNYIFPESTDLDKICMPNH